MAECVLQATVDVESMLIVSNHVSANANDKGELTPALEGAKLYALRKQTVEPAFGIIKQCMRFRQFFMRGKERVSLEWNLVCSAYNMKRLFNLTRTREGGVLASETPKPV